ncbi:unknown [Orgyia pseudotsugata multiple nucleopolyhedrovirus]|uniref:Uncharacterized protein n=1 Tax=Orgyia pseudotsugata multicapsid polyhedrosis virus TaxID=262177 RepID=O10320_NPVOP|nr:hypothetical protein OpmnVgp066 [Orgyia pseudotsugata multiple nucleopolyhedrovirus]AAC59065.1 unknown [Orgyia pseudotsugata multiple nucleopolyhedrovirus]
MSPSSTDNLFKLRRSERFCGRTNANSLLPSAHTASACSTAGRSAWRSLLRDVGHAVGHVS